MLTEIHLGCVYRSADDFFWRTCGVVFGDVLVQRVGDKAELRVPIEKFKTSYLPPERDELIAVNHLEDGGKPVDRKLVAEWTAARAGEPNRRRRLEPAEAEAEPGHSSGREPGILVRPSAVDALDRLVLSSGVRESIEAALRMVLRRADIQEAWGISEVFPMKACAISFFGEPGTGKTCAARGVALRLGRPMYLVDYAALVSKWMGDTDKHIRAAFSSARSHGAVLFFDEADTVLSRRIADVDQTAAIAYNQNRDVLMQELDRHDGLVIFSTNLFRAYDGAALRRMAYNVEFPMPDSRARRALFERHLPNLGRVDVDGDGWRRLVAMTKGLSGGDIANACLGAMVKASTPDDVGQWRLGYELLASEVAGVIRAKSAHARPAREPLSN